MSKGMGIKEVRDTRERGEPFKDFKYEKAILALLLRRPCRVIDISLSMEVDTEEVKNIFAGLLRQRILEVEEHNDQIYYRAVKS